MWYSGAAYFLLVAVPGKKNLVAAPAWIILK
jgi:hypothetical protein